MRVLVVILAILVIVLVNYRIDTENVLQAKYEAKNDMLAYTVKLEREIESLRKELELKQEILIGYKTLDWKMIKFVNENRGLYAPLD